MAGSRSLWDRCVELTVYLGERALIPVHRWIRRRSLLGGGPFFETGLFPWVEEVEEQWHVVRSEVERLLADREALPNFQDISQDQITITDDDRWKTVFLYGYGFEAKLGCELCPRTAEIVRSVPGMTTAMFSILSPRKHIAAHSGPYSGVLRYQLGLIARAAGFVSATRSATGSRGRA
jgi:ornithine lipid ester-linked acyl 2-hydroxylase